MPADRPVALVTGASDGIGRVVAIQLADRGYQVVAVARSTGKLVELAKEAGVQHPMTLDVADGTAVDIVISRIEAEIGPVDLLVNNAGVGGHGGVSWEYPSAATFPIDDDGPTSWCLRVRHLAWHGQDRYVAGGIR